LEECVRAHLGSLRAKVESQAL
ncbi:MAG: hypothetical protein QOI11_3492, partial [Candidatus Eremiobacteraeota bacterium]|nr:hypothetical protein [Candidatus Eremiobacteraeota bacterium]